MARKPVVSRTIKVTNVNALCLDTVACEPCNKDFTLPRTYSDTKKLLKVLKDLYETDELTICKIVDTSVEENLYVMDEEIFVSLAEKHDKREEKTE